MVDPTSEDGGADRAPIDDVFACVASEDRRRILGLLSERAPEPVTCEELATALAAPSDGRSPEEVTGEQRRQALVTLRHAHLPKLAAANLVERDDETVALTDHPAFRDPGLLEVLQGETTADPESLDALFRAITDGRRRAVLDVLSHQFGPIRLETLAREIGAYGRDVNESDVATEDVERVLGRLHHVDLPRLSDAGVVTYDADEQTVAYDGHPQLRVPWMHSVLQPEFRQSLTGEADPSGIGDMEGRENVVSFGQSLCDRADEELFCMFTDTQLLEAGCLTRIRDASRRGVDVYLGTRDPVIREYVRENAPEVVLWEPNTDWLNLPVAGDRVGRLLVADREAVMLGTLLEERTDGVHEEQAIVGEGEHNTLVTMICQLLGPHLEAIEEGAEDVEARLPL
ncbi:DUF7344 domain-containing protein [Halosimplex amylolyticum]|uniref:DUF7344 domain-containing protein n=1 Tax=Halosimplex amylolyticum TaxID=3396616 RepID=UPI003F567FEF